MSHQLQVTSYKLQVATDQWLSRGEEVTRQGELYNESLMNVQRFDKTKTSSCLMQGKGSNALLLVSLLAKRMQVIVTEMRTVGWT